MTEELNELCTDLKELFMKQDFSAMELELSKRTKEEVKELAVSQYKIVSEYFCQGKQELLLSHLNFVAFASYLYEYVGKSGILARAEFQQGFELFVRIYQLAQEAKKEKGN